MYYRILFSLLIIMICVGMNLNPVSSTDINISQGLNNTDIQTIINGAHSGDTINFTGNSYNNISLIINKKLNITSSKRTTILDKNSTGTFAFYFTNNSSGSDISGLNIITDWNCAILAENVQDIDITSDIISGGSDSSIDLNNVKNVRIINNLITNSDGNGINIENSKNITTDNNYIANNVNSGIEIYGSSDIQVSRNNMLNNSLSGVSIYSSDSVNINTNTIENNGHGIYLSNTRNIDIIGNNINANKLNGISLEDTTENSYISNNNITANLNGIYLDSDSINDTVISNVIKNSFQSVYTYLDVYDTGNGIDVGNNYVESNSLINIEYNIIDQNHFFSVKANPKYNQFTVGANWYGTANREYIGTCPMVMTCPLMAKLEKTSTGYEIGIYNGNTLATVLPSITATFFINGKETQIATLVNGTALFTGKIDSSIDNALSALVGLDTLNLDIPANSISQTNNTGNGNSHSSSNSTGSYGNNSSGTGFWKQQYNFQRNWTRFECWC